MSEPNKPATVPSVDDVVLLPCPFCGGDAKLVNQGDREDQYDIGCSTEGCYVEGGAEWWHSDIATLVAMWNTRSVDGHVVTFHREKAGVIAPVPVWVVVASEYMYGPYERWQNVEKDIREEWKHDRHMVG